MPTAVSMLEAFGANFPGLTQLLTMLSYLMGLGAAISSFVLLRRYQRFDGSTTLGGILIRLMLCATFLYLPTAISSGQETLFASPTLLSYSAGSAVSEQGKIALGVVMPFVQWVGLWAFIYGWTLLNRAHQRGYYDPGLGQKALAHILGGILCINLVATLQGAAQSFGLEKLLNYVLVATGSM